MGMAKAAALCVSMALALSAFAGGEPLTIPLKLDFEGPDSVNGWASTKGATLEPGADALKLSGANWDAKIYRSLQLEPGWHRMTATGKGDILSVSLSNNPGAKSFFTMNLAHNTWRTDWRPFKIEKPVNATLLVCFGCAKRTEAYIKQIKIERIAPPEDETGIPSAEELGRNRPVPEIARGGDMWATSDGLLGHTPIESKFEFFQSWHANVLRRLLVLKPDRFEDGAAVFAPGWEKQFARIDDYLLCARKHGFKVVLVMGYGSFIGDGGHWDNPKLPGLLASAWQAAAKHLLPFRDVIYGYDLLNEPLDWEQMPHPPRQWRAMAIEAIKAIREVDKETWIIYEPGPGGQCGGIAGMKPLPDPRVIYSIHYYAPAEFTHQGVMNIKGTDLDEVKAKLGVHYPGDINGVLWNKERIRESLKLVRDFQLKYNVPILVGEFSVVRWAPKPDSARYLQDLIDLFEEYHWSWLYHGFHEWHGWCLEYDESFCPEGTRPTLAPQETERAKVIKAGLAKNLPEIKE